MNSDDDTTTQSAYDKLAGEYAERVDEAPYNANLDFPAMTALMPDVEGKQVLDAGCGSGRYSEWLLERGAEVLAVDGSAEMVNHARQRVGNRAEVRQADLGEPFEFAGNDEFDVVVSALALNYVEDWRQMFIEFARVTKPEGVLLCSLQHPIDDYLRLEVGNYFEVERHTDRWSGFETAVEVPFYWRPLSETINPILEAGFQLDTLSEPQPTDEFKEKRPLQYEKVMTEPTFLCIRAVR